MANIVACRTYNLKLDEDEFAKLAELYSDIGELSKDKMKEYVNIIDEIINNAVVSGNLHTKVFWKIRVMNCPRNLKSLL